MRWLMGALAGAALCSCSFLYSPNNLPEPTVDAAPDAPDPPDPTMPMLSDISPAAIDEGQGDLGSRPALLVIRGKNLVNANLAVTLTAPGGETVRLEPVANAVASADGLYVAFEVTAPVDGQLRADVPLDVTIAQDLPAESGGGRTTAPPLTGKLTLRGLPELASASATVRTPLAPKYSMADLTNHTQVTFAGQEAVQLRVVSSITLPDVVARGVGPTAGPGGHSGGNSVGGGAGGGGVGGPASVVGTGGGGGGAGFATEGKDGDPGQGTAGGKGRSYGTDMLSSLLANRPSAGGAGGSGLLINLALGGLGGGGGGIIVLRAGGNIRTDTITVAGGNGSGPSGLAGGGGGGGGAGGVVLLATETGTLTTGAIDVVGGGSGLPGGGVGSVGRVRWDALDGTAPSVPLRPPHRGPSFMVSTRVFTSARPALVLVGTANDGFSIRVIDHDNEVRESGDGSFNSEGMGMVEPLLLPGHNQVCITLDGGMQGSLEADTCVDVAFLP
jgi:hypothetical protein